MKDPEINGKLGPNGPTSGYDGLKNVPFGGDMFIGPIPEDLKDIPENVARICLRQREIMDSPANKYIISYNLYARAEENRDPSKFPPRNEEGKIKKDALKQAIDAEDFWDPERKVLQDYGIKCQFENTVALSESMRDAERKLGIPATIYMLSGISAAGKTTACKNVGFPGMLYKIKPNGDKGSPIGTLATDNSKDYLWMAGGNCDQIHPESSMMMRKVDILWAEYVSQKSGDCSEVRDKTFSDIKDVRDVVQNAQETSRRIYDLDIDVPFIVSAVGVMMRQKGSHEPHPAFNYLKDNYVSMKETRHEKLTKMYPKSGVEVSYSLKCYDYTSDPKERQKEVAYYKKDEDGNLALEIIDEELYNQAVIGNDDSRAKCKEEADFVGNQFVTREFIDNYCKTYINPEDEDTIKEIKEGLEAYIDDDNPKTITEILNDNAKA